MSRFVRRTCTELRPDGADEHDAWSEPLSAYRSAQAYVLLGDPGSGKTTAFQRECKELGSDAKFITARNFLTHQSVPEELSGRTLFIDGLDEVRVGSSNARPPFDQIRTRLLALGGPRFRISCRQADWLADNDRRHFEYVAGDSTVTALRLDPLRLPDIKSILSGCLGVSDPGAFIKQARDHGVDGLLTSPQALSLLAKAVELGHGWPRSRLETFERACIQLAGEHNREHRHVSRQGISIESRIDCAGRLCAVQLISDRIGYSLDDDSADGYHPLSDACGQLRSSGVRAAVSSKLFRADLQQRFSPAHRQIAEFVGARYLARLIDNGLPARRVLALMTGGDGVVVTALRGLSAWLATLSEEVRDQLIVDDPVGLGLYGDIRVFPLHLKRKLLASLVLQPKILARACASASVFAPLAAPETESQILEVLDSADRSPGQEARARFMLTILSQGQGISRLTDKALGIARDESWSPQTRELGLDALIRNRRHPPKQTIELKALLEQIAAGGISVANRNLCGTLLETLYPNDVGPRQVWNYLTQRAGSAAWDRYAHFWTRKLNDQSSDDDVSVLLDSLACQGPRLIPAFELFGLGQLPIALLERGLRSHGDCVSTARLYDWLGSGVLAVGRLGGYASESVSGIRTWLEERPEIQKEIFLKGLEARGEDDRLAYRSFRNRERLFDAKLPADFGLWCLNQAVALAATGPQVARLLFLEAFGAYRNPGSGESEGLSLGVLQAHVRSNEELAKLLTDLLSRPPDSRDDTDWRRKQEKHVETEEWRRREWLDWIRSNKSALLENRAQPALLHQLAQVYFGKLPDAEGNSRGRAAIARVLGESCITSAAMQGLRLTIDRDDLPSVRQVIRFANNQQENYLGLPLLAALEEAESSSTHFPPDIERSRLRAGVACYHCWAPDLSCSGDGPLAWYKGLLDSQPEIVSEVAVRCASAAIRGRHLISPRFWDVIENEVDGAVARRMIVDLLEVFPTRCKADQLETLDSLIWSGIRHGAQAGVLDLASRKLSKVSMNVSQQVRWLGLGLICAPKVYRDAIDELVDGKERLIRHLAQFYVRGKDPVVTHGEDRWHYPYEDLDSSTLKIVICYLGQCFAPYKHRGFGYITDEVRVSVFLDGLIGSLASNPEKSASAALESLLADTKLVRWREQVANARDSQHRIRRDAEYRHPTLEQACNTLSGGQPANLGDLAALTVDLLEDIAIRLRGSNTNGWRQYWNEGKHGKPSEPRVEHACRDSLLSGLRTRLPRAVTAEPGSQYVSHARADITVAADGLQLPIELKRNGDRQLWTAVHDQLGKKYARDPAADGYGVYLVLWFGKENQRRRADGFCPTCPEELRECLENSLGEGEGRQILIRVIDVTPPTAALQDRVPNPTAKLNLPRLTSL